MCENHRWVLLFKKQNKTAKTFLTDKLPAMTDTKIHPTNLPVELIHTSPSSLNTAK